MGKTKYTKPLLEDVAKKSLSIAEMLRHLGLGAGGGSHRRITTFVHEYEIDVGHFLGSQRSLIEGSLKPAQRRTADDILVEQPTGKRPEHAVYVTRALLDLGVLHRCAICGLGSTWQGKHLTLQIDHINGVRMDNRIENVRFMCPNCHSQTSNFGSKNAKVSAAKEDRRAPKARVQAADRESRRPKREVLAKLLWEIPTVKIAAMYNVSDTAVGKWAKSMSLAKPPRGYWAKLK